MPELGCARKHGIVTRVQGCAYQSNNITLIECRDDPKLVTIVFNDLKWKCIKYSYIVTIISDTVYIVACISSRYSSPPLPESPRKAAARLTVTLAAYFRVNSAELSLCAIHFILCCWFISRDLVSEDVLRL